jgi:hypothetical protein
MPVEQKINCRSGKETFNQEVQQQWQQSQHDTSAEEFAQNWNFLYKLQSLANSKSDPDRLSDVDQNLDDVEDLMEDETDWEENKLEAMGREKNLQRKRVSLCRHKLQGRAYPKHRNRETTKRPPQPFTEEKKIDSSHEWLQLMQIEKFIETQKRALLKSGTPDLQDEDDAWDEHQEAGEDAVRVEEDNLDNEDLVYITTILN